MSTKIIVFSLIAIVILGLVGAGIYYFPNLQSSIPGFTTLSLTQADMTSDSPYLNGDVWILTVRQGGLGQNAYGTITPNDVQAKTPGDLTTTKNLKINIDYYDQECVYPVQQAGNDKPIYQIEIFEYPYIPVLDPCTYEEFASRDSSKASKSLVNGGRYFKGAVPTCWHVYWKEKTEVGVFGNTDLRSRFKITLEAGSDKNSRTLDTEGSIQGSIGDFAYAIWDGNLDTGKSCSYTTDMPYKPAFRDGSWIVVDKSDYQDYRSTFISAMNQYTTDEVLTRDEAFGFKENINNDAQTSLIARNFGSYENPTSFNNAVLKETMVSPLQNPVTTLYIKADTLGIYTPAPEIQLVDASSECFGTGEEGVITIEAKNTGNENGVWNFYGTCDSGFSITRSQEYGIYAGQVKSIIIPLSGTTSESQKTGKCTVYAENVLGTKSIQVGVCVTPQTSCNPNDIECGFSGGQHVIKKCNSAGTGFSIVESCGTGEVCEVNSLGQPKCVGQGGGSWWDKILDFFGINDLFDKVNDFIKDFRIILSIVLGFLGGLLSALFTIRFFNKELGSKKGIVVISIFLVIGLSVGLLAYFYFWYILIALIIVGVIKVFV